MRTVIKQIEFDQVNFVQKTVKYKMLVTIIEFVIIMKVVIVETAKIIQFVLCAEIEIQMIPEKIVLLVL